MDGKLVYTNWDDYARDFPDGDHFWRWVTNSGRSGVSLIKADTPKEWHFLLPGNYIWFTITPRQVPSGDKRIKWVNDGYRLIAHDADDFSCEKTYDDQLEAFQQLRDLEQLAPFSFFDLIYAFGFSCDY